MSDSFSFKKGAQLPSRSMTLTSDATFDLTEAASVTFVYRAEGGSGRSTIAAVVLGAASIRVDFGPSDVATVGRYEWHVEAVFDGKTMCFPERTFYTFAVVATIDA